MANNFWKEAAKKARAYEIKCELECKFDVHAYYIYKPAKNDPNKQRVFKIKPSVIRGRKHSGYGIIYGHGPNAGKDAIFDPEIGRAMKLTDFLTQYKNV